MANKKKFPDKTRHQAKICKITIKTTEILVEKEAKIPKQPAKQIKVIDSHDKLKFLPIPNTRKSAVPEDEA